jgi:hypothetical protein
LPFTTNLIGINYHWQVATDAAFSTIVGTGSTHTFRRGLITFGIGVIRTAVGGAPGLM